MLWAEVGLGVVPPVAHVRSTERSIEEAERLSTSILLVLLLSLRFQSFRSSCGASFWPDDLRGITADADHVSASWLGPFFGRLTCLHGSSTLPHLFCAPNFSSEPHVSTQLPPAPFGPLKSRPTELTVYVSILQVFNATKSRKPGNSSDRARPSRDAVYGGRWRDKTGRFGCNDG